MTWVQGASVHRFGRGALAGDADRRVGGIRCPSVTLDDLAAQLREFARERDWERFHTPKNLAVSLAVEVGEVLEHVQWGTDEEIAESACSADGRAAIAEEMADVFIYLVRLADVVGVDLMEAATAKLAANARRYPADEVRGSSAKRPSR